MTTPTSNAFCERCGAATAEVAAEGGVLTGLVERLWTGPRQAPPVGVDDGLRLCLECRGYVCAGCMNEDAGLCVGCAPLPFVDQPVTAVDVPVVPEAIAPALEAAEPVAAVAAVEPRLAVEPSEAVETGVRIESPTVAEAPPAPIKPPAVAEAPPAPIEPPAVAEAPPAPIEPPALADTPPAPIEAVPPIDVPPATAAVEPPTPVAPTITFAVTGAPQATARRTSLRTASPSPPSAPAPVGRACGNCELPISAHAAFCRRCGTAQPRVA